MATNDLILINKNVLELIQSDPSFVKINNLESNYQVQRDITFYRLKKIIDLGIIDVNDIMVNPSVFLSVLNTLHLYDASIAIKMGVNFGLFGCTLLKCGEPDQKDKYLDKLNKGKIFGCLAMTEIGHGSNLKGLETTATYNPALDKFIINSPTPTSAKCWIGNAACHGTHAVVFAQLIMPGGVNMHLHPFLVKIRCPKTGILVDGVTIIDNGLKKGLNGVDNGIIRFNNVPIKRNKLLRNFGYVNDEGLYCYKSEEHKSEGVRFGALLSTLSGGRGVLAFGSNLMSIKAIQIAFSYAMARRQFNFSGNGAPEKLIIEYTTHQTKLVPLFAKTIIIQNALNVMKTQVFDDFHAKAHGASSDATSDPGLALGKRGHILSSGFKILCGEHAELCCRTCRSLCGGHGYSIENEIAQMHNDVDIYLTFEGDNTLLRQEISKNVLKKYFGNGDQKKIYQMLDIVKFQIEKRLNSISRYITLLNINNMEHIYWLLKYRTKYLAYEIVVGLINRIRCGIEKTEAWNRLLPKIMQLADAYMYEKIFKLNMPGRPSSNNSSQNNKPHCKENNNTNLLFLFAHQLLHDNSAWYLVNGLIGSGDVQLLERNITRLSRQAIQKGTMQQNLDEIALPGIFYDVPMLRKI
ncbi:putative acyl-CoA oxidase [Tupanvirus soda lake]|uniref:Acyl-CoA oxidase n=2 Tax=Tupanvirus TaxID=2094720 RepID=A0AC62ADD8_9VIRU|nr:putative acyl-CoA oxidase [Tupanvirus soda lake]QKU35764.1 putative acyl-CoA oxidase [Tupanvirus soda lake]